MGYSPPNRFNTPMFFHTPTYTLISGVRKKVYDSPGTLFFGCFRTFGGTDVVENGVYSVKLTGVIDTWYNPNIKSDCIISLEDNTQYEIVGEPENIDMNGQFLRFKVERLKGKA